MIELEGLLFDKMMEIRCENEDACVFIRSALSEFKVTYKQGCPKDCKYSEDCGIKNKGAQP